MNAILSIQIFAIFVLLLSLVVIGTAFRGYIQKLNVGRSHDGESSDVIPISERSGLTSAVHNSVTRLDLYKNIEDVLEKLIQKEEKFLGLSVEGEEPQRRDKSNEAKKSGAKIPKKKQKTKEL